MGKRYKQLGRSVYTAATGQGCECEGTTDALLACLTERHLDGAQTGEVMGAEVSLRPSLGSWNVNPTDCKAAEVAAYADDASTCLNTTVADASLPKEKFQHQLNEKDDKCKEQSRIN